MPFEEDHSQGKDRPVLVVGVREQRLLALMLTSKDHDRDARDEARYGRYWVDIGTGARDRQRRPSEVRVDRVLPSTGSPWWPPGCAGTRGGADGARFGARATRW